MELESIHPLAALLEPLSGLVAGIMVMSKTVAMVLFALAGGNISASSTGSALVTPLPVNLEVVFYTPEDRFTPSGLVRFELVETDTYLPKISLQLRPIDAIEFGAFTERHIDEAVTLEVCGQALFSPRLRAAITSGKLQLTGPDIVDPLAEFMANGCP